MMGKSGSRRSFYITVGICSFLSAVTTLLLIFLPRLYVSPQTMLEGAELINNPVYTFRSFVYLVHPFVVLMAAWGVAVKRFRASPGALSSGFIFFFFWGFTEALQQALTIVTLNLNWRAGFLNATDEATRVTFADNISSFGAIWDGLFFLLLIGFMLGNLLYGIAFINTRGLSRILCVLFFLIAGFTVFNILSSFWNVSFLDDFLSYLYPVVQPLARVLIGVWLIQGSKDQLEEA